MPSRRGERAAPPPRPGDWDLRFQNSDAAKGWDELSRVAPGNVWEAFVILRERPTQPVNPERQHRLRRDYAVRVVNGGELEQWQYEVTAGGRIWYCPDPDRGIVWLTYASPGHPKATG